MICLKIHKMRVDGGRNKKHVLPVCIIIDFRSKKEKNIHHHYIFGWRVFKKTHILHNLFHQSR